jgi:hypothetical protein
MYAGNRIGVEVLGELRDATLAPPTPEQVKASIIQVQIAAGAAGFWPTPPNSISGVYDAALHEALSRWAQRTGFALWEKQTYNLPTPGGGYITGPGGIRFPTKGVRLDGSGPKQTVISYHLQAFLGTQGISNSYGILWAANQGVWNKQPPAWWVYGAKTAPVTPIVRTTPYSGLDQTGCGQSGGMWTCQSCKAPDGTTVKYDCGCGPMVFEGARIGPEQISVCTRDQLVKAGWAGTLPPVIPPVTTTPPANADSATLWVKRNWKWLVALGVVSGLVYKFAPRGA